MNLYIGFQGDFCCSTSDFAVINSVKDRVVQKINNCSNHTFLVQESNIVWFPLRSDFV